VEEIDRRLFFKQAGIIGSGVLLAASPWLSVFSESKNTQSSLARIGVIGAGSRGQFLMGFLNSNPKVKITAVCDIYQPSIATPLDKFPKK